MPKRQKSRMLTIFLLKKEVREPSQIFKPRDGLIETPVNAQGAEQGRLFFQPSQAKPPAWLSLFRGAVEIEPKEAYNASTAAVWLLEVKGRQLAIAFGYGRNLLRAGAFEEDFGLKIALNAVDPNKIKSVDRMTLDAVAQQSRIQATRDAALSDFGLDVEQDLLRAVTGTPLDSSLGLRLTGRDALQTTIATKLADVPELLEKYLQELQKENYKSRFPWIDQIHEIHDPLKTSELDFELVRKLKTGDLDPVWLCSPEMLDWEGLAGFKYRHAKAAPLHADIHVQTFLSEIDDVGDLDDYLLKQRYQVYAIGVENDVVVRHWPVYRCLYCEVTIGTDTFLLNNGRWFRIATDFVTRINEAVEQIPERSLELPQYVDRSEAAYAKRVSDANTARFALMDRKLIGSTSLPTPIEFCDLYSHEKQIVHLKRYSGSSTLSHLFAQGVVSARVFLNNADFREELNSVLPDAYRLVNPTSKPNSNDYEIIFGIISQSKKKLRLPFFSRVNLKNARANLNGMGLKLSLCKIPSA